jgi:predicted KAP-like P-loop ATPase
VDQDRLGFTSLAKYLALSLARTDARSGLVYAISGPWGSGKSSLVNLITAALDAEFNDQRKPLVIRFNPWWFSSSGDILGRFFDQLQSGLGGTKRLTNVRAKLAKFADAVSYLPVPYASAAQTASKLIRPEVPDVYALKRELAEALAGQDRTIVVVMDDVDRLLPSEIIDVFRLVKAVADFPNVVYLLAFDWDIVVTALSSVQATAGSEYLEKIVQVTIEIPVANRLALEAMLTDRLQTILVAPARTGYREFISGDSALESVLEFFVTTPRAVARLSNIVGLTFPPVAGDVNDLDFVCIEALRVFCRPAYDFIRRHGEWFTGPASESWTEVDRLKQFHDAWVAGLPAPDRQPVIQLVTSLFPRLAMVWEVDNEWVYGSDVESMRRARRIASAESFPTYFTLAVAEDAIAAPVMMEMIDSAVSPDSFVASIRRWSAAKIRNFLTELSEFGGAQRLSDAQVSGLMMAFLEIGDWVISQGAPAGRRSPRPDALLTGVMTDLLSRLSTDHAYALLERPLGADAGLTIATELVLALDIATLEYEAAQRQLTFKQPSVYYEMPPTPPAVDAQQLVGLRALMVRRIGAAAADGSLAMTPRLSAVLRCWAQWGGPDGSQVVREWCQSVLGKDAELLAMMFAAYKEAFSDLDRDAVMPHSGTDVVKATGLQYWFDPARLSQRLRALVDRGLVPQQQLTDAEILISGFDEAAIEPALGVQRISALAPSYRPATPPRPSQES